MASGLKNLSAYDKNKIPSAKGMKIGVVVSEWNDDITGKLLEGALETLTKHGVDQSSLFIKYVPGSFELPLGAQFLLESTKELNAVICLGCVIQGETRHFEFICDAVSNGIMNLGLKYNIPVIFGVLTTDTLEQAIQRSGGKLGNKGVEAAITAIKMASLHKQA